LLSRLDLASDVSTVEVTRWDEFYMLFSSTSAYENVLGC